MSATDDIETFLAAYPPEARAIIDSARRLVLEIVPDADETLDAPARMIAYTYGPGYKGMLFSVIPNRGGAKIGVVRGAALTDPDRLLEGRGKVHRHVAFASVSDLDRAGLRELLLAAVEAWREREGIEPPRPSAAGRNAAGRSAAGR